MREEYASTPPRDGEGDRSPQASGVGVFVTSRRTIKQARRERRSGNLPEVLLWRALRTRPNGFKFRRQHPIGPYVLDFTCLEARLAIEIDGEAHSRGDRPQRDIARDRHLESIGFDTLRLAVRDVLADMDATISGIVAACLSRKPLHRPAGGPPPRAGEV